MLCGCDTRSPVKYVIPDGYRGWVVIFFDHEQEPSLPTSQGYRVCTFSKQGKLYTSSAQDYGKASDIFVFMKPDGSTSFVKDANLIRAHTTGEGYEYFFVGSETELNAAESFEDWVRRFDKNFNQPQWHTD